MKLQRTGLLVLSVLVLSVLALTVPASSVEFNATQGLAFWSSDDRVAARKTPVLTVLAPIPASVDPSPGALAEVSCFAFASRDAGERAVKGARGRLTTYAYALDAASGTFEKTVLAEGEVKTARDGQASWTAEISTGPPTMWSVSELVWINSRKVEFTGLGCIIFDQEETGTTSESPRPPRR